MLLWFRSDVAWISFSVLMMYIWVIPALLIEETLSSSSNNKAPYQVWSFALMDSRNILKGSFSHFYWVYSLHNSRNSYSVLPRGQSSRTGIYLMLSSKLLNLYFFRKKINCYLLGASGVDESLWIFVARSIEFTSLTLTFK